MRTIKEKSVVKLAVYDNTFEAFNMLKDILHELVNDLNPGLQGMDHRIRGGGAARERYPPLQHAHECI